MAKVRTTLTVLLCLLLFLLSAASIRTGSSNVKDQSGRPATVTRVIDGDTIEVHFPNGINDTIRLIGVDTPETYGRNHPDEFEGITSADRLRTWGKKATTYARRQLAGRRIRLLRDANLENLDYFGRLLRYVRVNGALFNRKLIQKGYARVYELSFSRREGFRSLEKRALKAEVGVWGTVVENNIPKSDW